MSFWGCHQLDIPTLYNCFTAMEDSATLGSDMSAIAGLRGAIPIGIVFSRENEQLRERTGHRSRPNDTDGFRPLRKQKR